MGPWSANTRPTCHQASNFWQMVNMSIMSKLDGCQNWATFHKNKNKHKGPWSKVSKVVMINSDEQTTILLTLLS